MKGKASAAIMLGLFTLLLYACGGEPAVDVKKLMASPKAFVGSDTCKMCHLEHFDSWMMTLHSRMTQDVQKNRDVIIADFDEKRIREDLAKLGDKLKVPADKIFIPKVEDIKYTIGSQWKQRYIIEKGGVLYIAPIQYNADTDRWVNYNEATWEKNPWLLKCGGCHATGVDLDDEALVRVGERIWNLERLWNLRAGFTAADDTLPRRMLEEAIPSGPAKGEVNRLSEMLPDYYRERGWNAAGVPSADKLRELGLA